MRGQTSFPSIVDGGMMSNNYGSLNAADGKPLPGAKSTVLPVTLSTVALAAIIGSLFILFGGIALLTIITLVIVVYVLAFIGFCGAAVPYACNPLLVPFIAIQLQIHFGYMVLAYAARGFKPRFPQWTLGFELTNLMLRYTMVQYGHLVGNKNAHLLRSLIHLHGKMILKSNSRLHGTAPEKLVTNGKRERAIWGVKRQPQEEEDTAHTSDVRSTQELACRATVSTAMTSRSQTIAVSVVAKTIIWRQNRHAVSHCTYILDRQIIVHLEIASVK